MTEEQKIIKRDLQEAEYIGEDGGMVVDGRFTQLGAYRKMVKKLREDIFEDDVKDWMDDVKPSHLGKAYFHLVGDKDTDELGFDTDTEWYVSLNDKSPYEVWVYWG